MTEQRLVPLDLLEVLETICACYLLVGKIEKLQMPATEEAVERLRAIIAFPQQAGK